MTVSMKVQLPSTFQQNLLHQDEALRALPMASAAKAEMHMIISIVTPTPVERAETDVRI